METHGTTWSTARFHARAFICFVPDQEGTVETSLLVVHLLEVDAQFPWQQRYKDGTPASSIGWHSDKVVNAIDGQGYMIEFHPSESIKASQQVAYYRYAMHLAQRLAVMRIPGVVRVECKVAFEGVPGSFPVSDPIRYRDDKATAWHVVDAIWDIARAHYPGTYHLAALAQEVERRLGEVLDEALFIGAFNFACSMHFVDKVGDDRCRYHRTHGTRAGGPQSSDITAGFLRSYA